MGRSVFVESGRFEPPAVVVHGGAGGFERIAGDPELAERLREGLERAVDAAWERLVAGEPALEAAVAAVRVLEDDGHFNAGRGAVPTTAGTFEMDAAVMDGGGRAGAVAALTGFSAVGAARALAVDGLEGALLLAGAGADRFAAGHGVPAIRPAAGLRTDVADPAPLRTGSPHGTVGAVVLTGNGDLAAATSTGGRPGQPPGRVGDSPIPGAGTWADRSCAVSATGAGEAFILAGFARRLAEAHAVGRPVDHAFRAALDAVAGYGGEGGGIALGSGGEFVAGYDTRAMARAWRHATARRVVILD